MATAGWWCNARNHDRHRDAADVERLVKAFYDKLLADPEMRHFFADLDLPHHLTASRPLPSRR